MGQQSINYESIESACNNLTSLTGSLEKTIDTIDSAISKICHPAWEGTAAENFRKELKSLADNLPVANKQLAMSVLFLASCSDGYKSLGEANVNKLKELIGGQEYIDSIDVSKLPTPDLTVTDSDSSKKTEDPAKTSTDQQTQTTTTTTTSSSPTSSTPTSTYYSTPSTSTPAAEPTASTPTTVEIPSSVNQGGYTVTGYDYWINTGNEMKWVANTKQEAVSEIWKKQGSRFKNGIAVINVDGVDRYLIAVTTKFGTVGDTIDVKLSDGTTIPCVIGDLKGSDATSEWGHDLGGGKVNVLEFEVQREKYLESGNPTTSTWGLDWDSNQTVKSMTNNGSILGATQTNNTVVTKTNTTGTVKA